jgi:hypothetical protein
MVDAQDHVVADLGRLARARRPQCTAFWPMMSKSGATMARPRRAPPAMKVSVPAARRRPRPTPARRGPSPAAPPAPRRAGAGDVDGGAVEQHRARRHGGQDLGGHRAQDRAVGQHGDDHLGARGRLAALAAGPRRRGTPATSKPVTSWPAATRLAAIGAPMLPNPMNPIFMSSPLSLELSAAPRAATASRRPRRWLGPGPCVMLPARAPVLVDDGRADAFEEIACSIGRAR